MNNPELWAETGGILGLILFALFVLMIALITTGWRIYYNRDQHHTANINQLSKDHKEGMEKIALSISQVSSENRAAMDSVIDNNQHNLDRMYTLIKDQSERSERLVSSLETAIRESKAK